MAEETEANKSSKALPQKWWQWVLLYPAVAIALFGAMPGLIDRLLAIYYNTNTETYSAAKQQRDMWAKNLACTQSPFAWYTNPSNVKVDATTCPSGDLLVRAMTPDNSTYYHWVLLDEVVAPVESKGLGLVPAAKAETLLTRRPSEALRASTAKLQLAQGVAQVICQRPVDQRIMVRRIQTPQGCFDEFVDMYSGAVVGRRAAPCIPQC